MTEKEYKKIISENEIDKLEKEKINELIEKIEIALLDVNNHFRIDKILKLGSYTYSMEIKDVKELRLGVLINNNISFKNNILLNNILYNEIENSLYFSNLNNNIKSFERKGKNNSIIKLEDGLTLNIYFLDEEDSNLQIKKAQFIEEINSKYTYFKNVIKFLKILIKEQKIEFIDDDEVMIMLLYGLEQNFSSNKYENYIMAFEKALDDFISLKIIEINNEYKNVKPSLIRNVKGYTIIDPFTLNNLTENINDVNISDFRKLKKRIQKLYEVFTLENKSALLTLDITPYKDDINHIYKWSFNVLGRNISNTGGSFEINEINYKTAILKGLFKGLKAIIDSNINNKNINIICPIANILKCEEKVIEEQENNSRRKTIVKLIEEQKLLIKWIN